MPTIICPKCQGKLRFPEDSPARRVKCPTCGNVFLSSEGVASSGTTGSKEAPKARDSKDFELPIDDDRGRRSRQRDEDDDDDDRDRGRRRSNRDDDEYDRDRDRGRRRDSRYEDDDDDRGRRRRDSDDDDYDRDDRRRNRRDEDDYDRPRRKKNDARAFEGQMNRASLGCLLNFIGGWLQVGALGIMAFVIFLSWCGVHEGLRIFTVIAGLLGLAYLLASATGIGFLISGPRNRGALGLSIATAGVAGLHLMTVIVLATSRSIGEFAAPNTARSTEVAWSVFVSQLQALPGLLFWEIGWDLPRGRVSDGGFLPVFLYFVEIARMVLFLLTLRAIMLCAKDAKGASTCMKAMIAYASGAGGLIIVGILFGLLLLGMKPTGRGQANLDSVSAIFHLCYLVLFLVPAALAVGTALIVKSVKGRIDYRR